MVLNEGHWLRQSYQEAVQETVKDIKRLRDVDRVVWQFSQYEFIDRASLAGIDMGQGVAEIDLYAPDELYDQILKEVVGVEIRERSFIEAYARFISCENRIRPSRRRTAYG